MGIQISSKTWNEAEAEAQQKQAIREAEIIDEKIKEGMFDCGERTFGIEQESYVVNGETFEPIDVSELAEGRIAGTRPETAVYCLEYDPCPPLPLTEKSLNEVSEIILKTQGGVEDAIRKFHPKALLIHAGTHPSLKAENWDYLIFGGLYGARYALLEEASKRENPIPFMRIQNPVTGECFDERATNLAANVRCFATQLHLGFEKFEDTLAAYNSSIAIAGPMIALLGNSPYAGGVDTGLGTARVEILAQGEQKRYRLAQYARSYAAHVRQEIQNPPPFDCKDRALGCAYGAEHITSRIILNEATGASRIEVRALDSMNPDFVPPVLVLHAGLLEALKTETLPTMEENNYNFTEGRKGSGAIFVWNGDKYPYAEMMNKLITLAEKGLDTLGMESQKEKLEVIKILSQKSLAISDIVRRHADAASLAGFQGEKAIREATIKISKNPFAL